MQDEFPVDRYRAATATASGSWAEVRLHGGLETGAGGSMMMSSSTPVSNGPVFGNQQHPGQAASQVQHGGNAAVTSMQVPYVCHRL